VSNILVIEDNPDNMSLIEEILEDEGYEVLKAMEAESGIKLLEGNGVDLILMDVSLPKMSGLEATAIIKANTKTSHIPIIALTAHAMEEDRNAAFRAGCDHYLTKPIDEELVLETIKAIL